MSQCFCKVYSLVVAVATSSLRPAHSRTAQHHVCFTQTTRVSFTQTPGREVAEAEAVAVAAALGEAHCPLLLSLPLPAAPAAPTPPPVAAHPRCPRLSAHSHSDAPIHLALLLPVARWGFTPHRSYTALRLTRATLLSFLFGCTLLLLRLLLCLLLLLRLLLLLLL